MSLRIWGQKDESQGGQAVSEYEQNEHLLEEIEQLRESNFYLRKGCEEQKQHIKQLEEAGDVLSNYLREMPYASDYLAQIDERILRIINWSKAKEAKP
jgi:DNA repair ATPase RecN